MPPRKPAGMSYESWIDRLLDRARREGEFDNLEGEGQPIGELDRSYDPDWWVKSYLRREKLGVLPPELELRRKVAEALASLASIPTESKLVQVFSQLNDEISRHNRTVTGGPASTLVALDLDRVRRLWEQRKESGTERAEDRCAR